VNGFVHSIGESHLLGRQSKVRGNNGFDGLALRIARESAGGDAAEHFAHARRASQGVLVEVQAQQVAAAKGRVILLHGLHAQAR
jgi:hypothetical protein